MIRGAAPKETAPLEGLYNFPKGRRGFFFLREAADNILPGDNADKAVQIVYHRNEIVADDVVQQLIQGGGNTDRGVFPQNIPDMEPFQFLNGTGTRGALVRQEPPEKISLADSAYVLAFAVDDGNSTAAMMAEFFQALAHRVIVIEESDAVLGSQKISNVHGNASFLMGGASRLGRSGVAFISIIYRKGLGKW